MRLKSWFPLFCCALALGFITVVAQAQAVLPAPLAALTQPGTPFIDGDRIVCFGDSITAGGDGPNGYLGLLRGAFLAAGHPAVTVINAGISGHKVPDLQARIDRDVLSKDPTVVFIYIGINDVWHGANGTKPDAFEAGLRDLITKFQAQGIQVVLATPTVIGEKPMGTNPNDKQLDQYADISRKVANDMNVELCDLRLAFADTITAGGEKHPALTADGVHLSGEGNALVAQEAAKSLLIAMKSAPLSVGIKGGSFLDATTLIINVRMQNGAKGANIYYTLDGTEPNTKSALYTKPVTIDATTTVKAYAAMDGQPDSRVITVTFTKEIPREPVIVTTTPGLNYDYYEGDWQGLPDFPALTATASGTTKTIDLAMRKREVNFAVKYSGYIEVATNGMYTFSTNSDDGSKLFIGEKLVVNNEGMHGPVVQQGTIALKAGKHPISVVFHQGGGGYALDVYYSGPNVVNQKIPADAFSQLTK